MLCGPKVATLLMLLGAALASKEEAEVTTTVVESDPKEPDVQDPSKESEGSTKTQEKRGLFRFTGVHGENIQPYQFVYTAPQQPSAVYQQPQMASHYEPRSIGTVPATAYVKPYPIPYAQPSYQQPFVISSPSSPMHAPIPYNAPVPYSSPSTMVLLMMPPHAGNPLGSLMLVPYNNIVPQYNPNPVVTSRIPYQFVPQYIPIPVKSYGQTPGYSAAHFKASEYSPKPPMSPQYISTQYQDQPSSSEEQDSGATSSPSYVNRRPVDYVKG